MQKYTENDLIPPYPSSLYEVELKNVLFFLFLIISNSLRTEFLWPVPQQCQSGTAKEVFPYL
jgi:hypothetical protein